jgi:hypothetical protein
MIRTFQELAERGTSSPNKLSSSQSLNRSSSSIGRAEADPLSKKSRHGNAKLPEPLASEPPVGRLFVPFGNYIIYRRQFGGEFHRSYVFFVEICARHVDVTLNSLHSAIQALEKPLTAKEKIMKQNFLDRQSRMQAVVQKRAETKKNQLLTYASDGDLDDMDLSDDENSMVE